MKETYENLKQLLNKLKYSKYGWYICGDLKVVFLMMGLQLGCTNYCCFLCEWDSRAKTLDYLKTEWPRRKFLKVGEKNVQHPALIEWHKILVPPLRIKLGLMKNFVKAVDRTGLVFKCLAEKFPRLSEAKIKRGFFWVLSSASSSETICSTTYFRVTRKKLGTRFVWCHLTSSGISGNYKELIDDMSLYHKLGCNMSLNIHMLHSHLDFFPDNGGMVSDEQVNVFIRKLQRWRKDIRESGPLHVG